MTFWFLIFALTLTVIIYVCRPLLRSNAIVSDEAQTEKRLYQARLAELDNEFSLGSIDEASLTSAKAEEARKLLKLSNSSSIVNPSLFSSKFSMLATALFIPIFSLVIYMSVGTPEVIFQQAVIEEASQSNLEELMAVAEKRLLEHPDLMLIKMQSAYLTKILSLHLRSAKFL